MPREQLQSNFFDRARLGRNHGQDRAVATSIHNLWATMGRTRAREREGAYGYPPMNDLPILVALGGSLSAQGVRLY